MYHTGGTTLFDALRNDLKQFLERIRDYTDERILPTLPLWRCLLEHFYVYLLLSLIVDILRNIRGNPKETEDIISLAIDARYRQLSRWDCLIVFLGPDYQVIEEAANHDPASVPQELHGHVQYANKILGRYNTLHIVFSQKWYLKYQGGLFHFSLP